MTSASDTSLTTGTQYYYYFFAINNDYYSAASTANATTWAVPAAPTLGTITPGNGQLSVAFTAGANNGSAITNYKWSTDGTTYTAFSPATTTSPLVITGLSNGTAYTVRIRAVNAVGDGAVATASSSSTPRTTPGAPTITGITAGSQQLSVAFSAPSSNGGDAITNYEFSTNDGSTWTTRSPASTTSPLVITGLNNGTSYTVRIRAVNGAGSGTQSASSAGTPVAAPTLTAVTLASALTGTYGAPSAGVSFTATGTSLTTNITVTAQAGFEVSTSSGSGYGSSVTVAGGTTVWVRTAASRAAGAVNDTVVAVLSGGGAASNVNVTSSGSSNTVSQAPLTITGLSAANKTYDGTTTASVSGTAAYSGLVNSESFSVSGTVTWAFADANVGTNKSLTRTGSFSAPSANYTVTQPTLAADITAKALTITANNVSKTYGATLTGGTGSTAFTPSGLVGSETIGTVTITYTGSPSGALATTGVGSYTGTVVPSSATGGTFNASNYSITYSAGNVTVNQAVLTVTARNQTVGTGTPVATVTGNGAFDYSGFVNSETSSVVSGTVTYTTTYTSSDAAGTSRTITPVVTGLSATNYSFTAANGTITVASPEYGMRDDGGSNLPTLTYWYAGAPADVNERGDQFSNRNLGNITSLFIKGANIKTYKNNSGNVTGTRFEYKIWRQGTTEPASFTTQSVGFTSNDGTGGNQTWSSGFTEIDVFSVGALGTNYGTYNVKIQFTIQGTGVAGKVSEGPYTATFTYPTPATISTTGTLAALTTTYGTASSAATPASTTSFSVSGTNMTAGITVTPPEGFEVSTSSTFASNVGTSASPITVGAAGTISATTVYVRLAANASAGTKSGNIVLSSSGATSMNVATASSTVNKKSLGVTIASQTITYGFPETNNVAKNWNTSVVAGGSYSVNASDLVNGDGPSVVTGTPTYTTTYVQGDAVGTPGRTITATGLTAANYNVNVTAGSVTIGTLNNPAGVAAASGGTNSVNLTHNMTNGIHVLIVRKQGSPVTWTPTDGQTYSDNADVGTGHTVLKGSLNANSSSNTGLLPNTTYHYKVFSEYFGYYSAGATASTTTDPLPPSVSISGGTLSFGTVLRTATATEQSYTVSGSNLTADLTITAPTGYQVSTTSGSGFGSSVTLTPTSGSVASTTIYVRYAPTADGAQNGNITHASTGLTTANKAVTGSGRDLPGGINPGTANATTAFVGDTVRLTVGAWQTWNDLSLVNKPRSWATVFGRFDNADLSLSANCVQGAGQAPGSSVDEFYGDTPTLTQAGTFYWAMRVSYDAGNDFWFDASRTNWSMLSLSRPSAASLSISVSALNNPSSLVATAVATNQVTLTWTKGNSGGEKDTLVLRNTSNSFTDPTAGTAYTAGATIGGATVVYKGNASTVTDSNLATGTQYFYKVYAENNSYYSPSTSGTVTASATTLSPAISLSGTLAAVNTTYGTASASPTSFSVSGSYLTGNLTVTPPAGYEVSTTAGSGYGSTATLTQSSGTVASTTVYVRLAATTIPGSYSGDVTVSGGGATSQTVATVSSTVSAKQLTITGLTGANKVYDGTNTASVTGTATLAGVNGSDTVSLTGSPTYTFADANVATGKAITASGHSLTGAHAGRYSLQQATGLTANITAKALTISGLTAANKTYDGTTTASVTGTPAYSGLVSGESFSVTGDVSWAFGDSNVGTGKVLSQTGSYAAPSDNYSVTQPSLSADITRAALTISGATASNRVYDRTSTVAVSGGSLVGVVGSDDVTLGGSPAGATANANVGTGKSVTVTGYSISGGAAGNYSLSQPTGVTVNITAKEVTVTGASATNRAYNGSTTVSVSGGSISGVISGDTVTLGGSPTGTVASAAAGAGKSVTVTGYTIGGAHAANYSLTQPTDVTVDISAATLAGGDITLTPSGGGFTASASGVSGFTYSYAGRTANGIATSYGPSATAPTAPGYYTVTATSSDSNYSGSTSSNYHVTGPIAANDAVARPAGNNNFSIPQATLVQNDKRIDGSGNVQTSNLSVTGVTASGPTVSLSGVMVNFTSVGAGAETFTYTVTDSTTGKTSTATVTVTPEASVEKFEITGTPGTPTFDGEITSVTMTFTGTPNTTYYVYFKGELSEADWSSAGGWYSENGTFTVEISKDGNHVSDWTGSMFFRAVK